VSGPLRARIAMMREAEELAGGPLASTASLLRLLRDVILLVKDLAADPRVPRRDKVVAAVAAGYVVVPVDLVPGWVPVLGWLDDAVALWIALRRLLGAAGFDVIYEQWRGTDEGLATVLTLAGVET
jgi:uncharacterized membrane protein YkvA (DUF1232 family)